MRKLGFGVAVLAMLALAGRASADLVITVGNITLPAGSSGYVPVYISSNDGDQIGRTSFQFQITTAGGSRLEFANSPAVGSDPTFSNPNYIFAGGSGSRDQADSLRLGTASGVNTVPPNQQFSGGDIVADFSTNVTVTSNGTMLLADLPVTALTGVPPQPGDTFSINATANNVFRDAASDNSFTIGEGVTANGGTVTIGASAVPLPKPVMAMLALFGMLAVVVGIQPRRHLQHQRQYAPALLGRPGHR